MRRVHQLYSPCDRRERQASGDALRRDDEVRDEVLALAGEHVAGAREAGLHLVSDEHDAGLAAPGQQRGQVAGRGLDEPALALDRFHDERGEVLGADLLLDGVDRALGGFAT